MSGPVVPEPRGLPLPEPSRVIRIGRLGRFRLRSLRVRWLLRRLPLLSERLATVTGERRRRRERDLVPGQLIVATRVGAADLANMIALLQQQAPLPGVADVPINRSRQAADPELGFRGRDVGLLAPAPLASNYFQLLCRPGYEQYLLQGLRIIARPGLKPADFEVVRAVRLRPAAGPAGKPGPIEFTAALDAAEQHRWLSEPASTGAGCQALMVDFDHPDPRFVCDVWPLGSSVDPIVDGHATVMAAAFRRMAPDASLHSAAMGPATEVGSWTLLDELTAGRGHDLIYAGIELAAGPTRREGRARRRVIERWLTDIASHAPFPVLVFPTGNAGPGEPVDTIAIPACLDGVVALGSVDTQGRRSSGSRFRRRSAPEPAHWWMVPGGDFPDPTDQTCLMTMAGVPQAGTSVAAGFGAGLLAGVLAEVRADIRLGRGWLATALGSAEAELERVRAAGWSEAELVPLRRIVEDMEQLNAPGPGLLPLVIERSRSAPVIDGYTPETCGRGLLRVSV